MSATIFESSFPGTVYLFDRIGLNIPREISDTISGSNFIQLTAFTGSDNTSTIKITSLNSEIIGESPQRLEVNSILSGINPTASAPGAATFGINNIATNTGSFVEGVGTLATGFAAHAAGFNTTASGYAAFSVGVETDADGTASFAAGSGSWARGTATVAFGIGTIASSSGQLAVGHYNEAKTDINNIFVVGDGTSNSLRRNVIEVYGGQGASLRGVKIDTVSPSGPPTTTIDGFNVYGRTIFYGGVTHSTGIITIDNDYGGITHGSASYIAETYTSLGALRGRTLFNYKGIDFNNSVQTTAPSSTHLWSDQLGELYYGSNAVILNNATNFTASNVTVSNVTVTGTASIAFLNVTYESASVIYSTGSNQFGDAANDTQTLYGSVIIPTGSLTVTGSLTTTGDITTQNLTVANITASENIRIGRTKSIGGNNFGTYNPILTYWNDGVSGAVQSASFGFRGSAYMDSIAYPDAFGFGTNDLRFFTSTNGIATPSEIMRIVGSTGFVGIGETSPSAKLEIKGSGATSATTAFRVENSSATSLLTILNDGTSAFNTNHLYVSSSGNVGIGLTSPLARLHISGANALRMQNTGFDTFEWFFSAGTGIGFRNVTDGTTPFFVGGTDDIGIGTTNTSARLHVSGANIDNLLRVSSPSAANALFVSGSGRVGMGTATPTGILHISGSGANTFLRLQNPATTIMQAAGGATNSGSVVFFGTTPTSGYDLDVQGTGTTNGGTVRFAANSTIWTFAGTSTVSRTGTGATDMFNVTMTGTSATAIQNPMSVTFNANQNATSGSGYIVLRLNATHASTAGTGSKLLQSWEFGGTRLSVMDLSGSLGIGTGSAPPAKLFISGASNQALFEIDSPSINNIIYVSGSGNVGIGTGTPTNTLQVNGGITATSITASIISASSGITGSLFGTSSWAVSASQALTASFLNGAFLQNGNSFGTTAILGTNDNQNLQFETSGSVRMTISSSGNIGIGTNLPSASLHISGASADSLLRVGSPTQANTLFITGSNRVGIGTGTPRALFEVNNKIIAEAGGNVGIQIEPLDWIHLSTDPGTSKYLRIDAPQVSNPPPLTAASVAKNGYGIVVNENYLAEPDYWMEISLDGTIVLIPCYLPG